MEKSSLASCFIHLFLLGIRLLFTHYEHDTSTEKKRRTKPTIESIDSEHLGIVHLVKLKLISHRCRSIYLFLHVYIHWGFSVFTAILKSNGDFVPPFNCVNLPLFFENGGIIYPYSVKAS